MSLRAIEIISSRQNPLIKTCSKLASQRRERLKQRQTVLDGSHLLAAALDAGWKVPCVLVAESWQHKAEITGLLPRCSRAVLVSDALLAEISELDSPSGILALANLPDAPAARRDGMLLLLDGVQDPGNVGSILRTAAAAGIDQVWLSEGCADVWSPKVLRAGMGAQFLLPLLERADLPCLLADYAGRSVVTTLQQSQSLYQTVLDGDLAFIVGSEGAGVSATLQQMADVRIRIPMREGLESLNVGAAAAICLYEWRRQHDAVQSI